MIEKILIEINRLKNELDGYSAREALDYIESYINTLSKQQVEEPVPAQWGAEHLADARKTSLKDLADAAKFSSRLDGFFYGKGYEQAEKDILSKFTKEHLEGLRWIERSGITSQPTPYHKYCKDLYKVLEELLKEKYDIQGDTSL